MAETLTARVIKATSLLGSTQMLNMVCSVVRTKLLALWVGPTGVALNGVLSTVIELFSNLTQLNIRTTAVRDLAILPPGRRDETVGIVRRVSSALGVVGMLLMFALAPLLSRWMFDSGDFAWAFRIASVALLFQALQGSEMIVLQAEGHFRRIASSGLITSVAGLIIAAPLFLGLKTGGVAPAIVGASVAAWLGAAWFARGYRSAASTPALRECFRRAVPFIRMGFLTVVAALVGNLVSLVFSAIVQRASGDVALGLYQAGNTMLIRYVGVFFVAIGVEFYPRLASAEGRPHYARLLMTHQARVMSLMFLPCAVAAMLLTPWLIRLLYDGEYLPMASYFVYGMVGMMLRPASVVLSYGFLAGNRARPYLLTEVASSLAGLGLCTAGYLLGSWTGLGLATAAWYLFDILIIYLAARLTDSPVFGARTLALSLALAALLLPLAALLA